MPDNSIFWYGNAPYGIKYAGYKYDTYYNMQNTNSGISTDYMYHDTLNNSAERLTDMFTTEVKVPKEVLNGKTLKTLCKLTHKASGNYYSYFCALMANSINDFTSANAKDSEISIGTTTSGGEAYQYNGKNVAFTDSTWESTATNSYTEDAYIGFKFCGGYMLSKCYAIWIE